MESTGFTPRNLKWIREFQLLDDAVIESLGSGEKAAEKYGEMVRSQNKAEVPEELRRK